METEAAAPRAKKRRTEEPRTQESEKPSVLASEAAASDAPDPEPATTSGDSRSQEPPPPVAGGEDGDGRGVDCISGLPDAILGEIVSLLPTKEAARTQIVASRWRHVWRAAPLSLDGSHLAADDEALVSLISLILAAHRGPGRRFCFPLHHLHHRRDTVDAWLRSPALDNLQELEFWEDRRHRFLLVYPPATPPESAFRFSATLRVATFSKCHFLDITIEALRFPKLRQLALFKVGISEDSLHALISSCPALECLLLEHNFGFRCLRISSNVKSIGVAASCVETHKIQELIIVDAPCLEKLLFLEDHMYLNVSVISAPNLATMGYFSDRNNNSSFVFGATAIQGLQVVSLKTAVHSVKILAIGSRRIELDMVIDLMKCFPCLEKLYIKSYISGMNLWRCKHRDFIQSFDIRLKEVVLGSYRGIRLQASFASFFIMNARQLELIRFVVGQCDYNEDFFAEQHRVLQMEKRASRDARLDFTIEDRCRQYLLHVNHVRDLSVTDPFQCTC